MIDIFSKSVPNVGDTTCHTGGAPGSDTVFEETSIEYGIRVCAYSYKTEYHKSPNKVEISDEDYNEGVQEINKANKSLGRYGISKYMNLLARNWVQVKKSKQIFAIGTIVEPGSKNAKGYYSKSRYQTVDGGTGYAVQMGINNNKDVYVFNQANNRWYRWSYNTMSFVKCEKIPTIDVNDFAGIGTREISENGVRAIKELFENTFITK